MKIGSFRIMLFAICLGVVMVTATAWTQPQKLVPKIWQDPGTVEKLNLQYGPGGAENAPKPPFTLVEEDMSGTTPKVIVVDATNREWGVKWGTEVNSEVFASRIAWAAGYFAEPIYYVGSGKIEGVHDIHRTDSFVDDEGNFKNARFRLYTQKGIGRLYGPFSWNWDKNPFTGTKELNGLKVVMMLVSNWDSKDQRDAERGSNTVILRNLVADEEQYVVDDWGGSMGKWGGVRKREKWNCEGYTKETDDFIKKVEKDAEIEFGYSGQNTPSIADDIRVSDVKWLMTYLGRLTDSQIRAGLAASGATPAEVDCFASAIRKRLTLLDTSSR